MRPDLDALHFRKRAAIARELAQAGEDLRLAQMLMELAIELEAEADAIEAEQASTGGPRAQQADAPIPGSGERRPAQIIDLTLGSLKPAPETRSGSFNAGVLPFPGCGMRPETTTQHAEACELVPAPENPSRAAPARAMPADTHQDARTLLTMS